MHRRVGNRNVSISLLTHSSLPPSVVVMVVVVQSLPIWLGLTIGVLLGGCIGTSPEEQRRAELEEAVHDDEGEPEHRPGQPCLACHGEDYHPGEEVFVLAGTIYLNASDPDNRGLEAAEVHMTDSEGFEFTALTNRAGNFMVQVDGDVSAPTQRKRGQLKIPSKPVFPVSVEVLVGGQEQVMESLIWREGSCSACHYGSEAGLDHVEKVWLEEQP